MTPSAVSRAEVAAEIQRRRQALTFSLLKVYNYYRVLVGLLLLVLFSQTWLPTDVGSLAPQLFFWTALGYTVFNVGLTLSMSLLPVDESRRQTVIVVLVCADVIWLALMMYQSGGVASGLDAFMLVTVTAGAIVVQDRWSTFVAAIASIAVLYQELHLALQGSVAAPNFFEAGVLGLLLFAFALLVQNLSSRLRENEMKALTHAAEVEDLERINKQIIQRMQTGIVVVDNQDRVRMQNHAAGGFLGRAEGRERLPQPLQRALDQWRQDRAFRIPPFQAHPSGPEIRVNFAPVRPDDPTSDVTIFIEDAGELQSQVQQLKLAELGRLSASIAHEIRNPLAAISHAAQLLQESRNLDRGDERLTDIIHNHTKRMNQVVENVLEMSRRNPPNPERVQLGRLVDSFVDQYLETEPSARIVTAVTPMSAEVRVDPRQLNQVLTNLVSNALTHGQSGGKPVEVHIEGGIDEQTERPYINVSDNGPGVPPDKQNKLFQPFHTTKARGTGLGLYLSRELCEANLARLSYLPAKHGGACFRILFAHPDRISA